MLKINTSSPYTASMTREQFLFYEVRTTAKLMTEGLSDEEVVQRIIDDNLFQYPTEKSLKRIAQLLEIVRQCMEAVHSAGNSNSDSKEIITRADTFYSQYKTKIADLKSLALLDGLVPPMIQYKDTTVDRIEGLNRVKEVPQPSTVREPAGNYGTEKPSQPKKIIKSLNRQVVFPAKRLESESDVDEYVEKMRTQLKQLMKNCDGIQLN